MAIMLALAATSSQPAGGGEVRLRQCFEAGLLPCAAAMVLLPGVAIWNLIRKLDRLGALHSLFLAGLIPMCWLFAVVLFGFVCPWCVGLVWLMLKSM